MSRKILTYLSTILCSILVASLIISDVNAKPSSRSRRSFHSSSSSRHSYPSHHGGLSGSHSGGTHSSSTHHQSIHSSSASQSHGYPSSHSSGGHGYPSSHSMSGGSSGGHGYPSSHSMSGGSNGRLSPSFSSGVHSSSSGSGYPSSNTLSGTGSKPVSYPAAAAYPSSNSLSGTGSKPAPYPAASGYPSNSLSSTGSKPASYPASPGLSGGTHYPGNSGYPHQSNSGYPHHTNTHNNVHTSTSWVSQPVHQHTTHNTYVIQHTYRPPSVIHYHTSSGPVSYPVYTGTLPPYVYEYRSSHNKYNSLLAGLALYNLGRMSSDSHMHTYHQHYVPEPGEYCKFGVRYRNGMAEEMAVDCRSVTYFIYQENRPGSLLSPEMNKNMHDMTAYVNTNTQQVLSSSGMLVQGSQPVNTISTTATQGLSVTDQRFYGDPVVVRPDMECYVSRTARFSHIVKPVPCDLLQTYSSQSLYRRNSAPMIKSSLIALVISFVFLLF